MSAPYTSSMRLGMGFNAFTQESCSRNVVQVAPTSPKTATPLVRPTPIQDQQVHSSAKFVSRFSELVDAVGVTPAAFIRKDSPRGAPYASFLNIDHFNSHHIHYFIHVLATRDVPFSPDPDRAEFETIPTTPEPAKYGDSFVSGFVEGGELVALISVKLREPTQENIAAAKGRLEAQLDLGFRVASAPVPALREVDGETTTIVQWKCGHRFDAPNQWTPQNLREEVMSFPEYAFAHPVRLSPILSKYTTVKGFCANKLKVPEYEKSGAYIRAASLLDDYVDYKGILGGIKLAALDVDAGRCSLTAQPQTIELAQLSYEAKLDSEALLADYEDVPNQGAEAASPDAVKFIPYAPTVIGLMNARRDCEREVVKIIQEVDNLAANPETNATVAPAHLNPAVFRLLLPRIVDLSKQQRQLERAEELENARLASAAIKQRFNELEMVKKVLVRDLEVSKRQLEPYHGWTPVPLGCPIRIVNVATTRTMDYDFTNSYGPSFDLHTWDWQQGNSNQQFEVISGDAKGYYIRHVLSGRYLTPARSGEFGVYMEASDIPFGFTFSRLDTDNLTMIHLGKSPEYTLSLERWKDDNGIKVVGCKQAEGVCDQWLLQMWEDEEL
ncbi:hypothetical protein MKEN_00861200 [Mycena kentingensis (nom. inval.)]|nr:hypothetical protein MKEN_00861200 [Mycena kentingensis (nom. inval.)]